MSVPWSNAALEPTLSLVEAVARAHGYGSPRCPSNSAEQLTELEIRLGWQLPSDLRAFLLWHDPDLWSYFVNADRILVSDHPTITPRGEMITPDHPLDRSQDIPRIDRPMDIHGGLLVRDKFGAYVNFFLSNLQDLGRADEWQDACVIAFGTSGYFEPVIYCIDRTDSSAGAIVTFTEDTEDRMWLADSLSSWLARLVACDGCEYAFMPGDFKDMPRTLRALYVQEFRAHNPRSSFFRQ